MNRRIAIYDTTLRDGSQSEDCQFSVEDKLRIVARLDEFGAAFIEGGWPGANPKDDAFFQQMKSVRLATSRLAAFGSTHKAGVAPEEDFVLGSLLRAETGVITIFGKTWDLHVIRALGISLAENLDLIGESIDYLKERVDTVFYDAEHFFDGYKTNPEYALHTLKVAREAGADCLILCDTNGGALVTEVDGITRAVIAALGNGSLGIHCHNDADLAVANTLAAVAAGVDQVHGTINGLGERCGNADLISVIPNLQMKMGLDAGIAPEGLRQLTSLSRFIHELANQTSRKNQPYVGLSAFAHKAGIHVAAVNKDAATYEHIEPASVGNQQRILVSEQAGRSTMAAKLAGLGIRVEAKDPRINRLLEHVKEQEKEGFQYDGAEASFTLLAWRMFDQLPEYFELHGFRVIDERRFRQDDAKLNSAEATVKIRIGTVMEHLVGEGDGPVDALHDALCKALRRYYPSVDEVKLVDYKVRKLSQGGTDAKVRVLVEWRDQTQVWGTVGVSAHIIEASYEAMVDAMIFKLWKDGVQAVPGPEPSSREEDLVWAVAT